MEQRPEMSDEMINQILNELVPGATDVCPFLMQEPMLEPRLEKILYEIKCINPNAKTWIYTTGRNLTEKKIEKLVDDGALDVLCLSYAGSCYEGIENVKRLLSYRGTRPFPKVEVHLIEGISPKLDWELSKLADQIRHVPFDTFHGDVKYPGSQLLSNGPTTVRKPCSRLWGSINIHSNGNVVPCCLDYSELYQLGNIKDHSIEKIWNSYQFMELRQMHLDGKQDEIELCKNCSAWRWM
jgi:radical SAM protein with 4Fe4S-binding SPASM domain